MVTQGARSACRRVWEGPLTLCHLSVLTLGAAFGASLSLIGFSDYGQVHKMFVFGDLRMIFVFAATVAGVGMGYRLLQSRAAGRRLPDHKPIHAGSLAGGVIFGVGWAVTGACPAIIPVQLGEGKLPALITAAGMVTGILLHRWARRRFLHFDTGSCG